MTSSVLWRYLAAVALFTLTTGVTSPIFPLYAAGLGVAVVLIGVFNSLGIGANALVRPISGRLSDRYGRRPFLVGGLLLLSAGYVSYAAAPRHGAALVLALSTVCIGAGAAAFWPSLKAALIEREPDRRERALGRITATQNICTAVGATTGGAIASALSYRWAFLIAAGCLLVAAVAVAGPATPDATAHSSPAPGAAAARDGGPPPLVLIIGGMIILVHVGLGATMSFLALYASDVHRQSPQAIGVLFTAVFLSNAAGAMLIGRYSGTAMFARLGRRRLLALALLAAGGVALLTPLLSFPAFVAGQLVIAITTSLAVIALVALTSELLSHRSLGSAIGTIEAVSLAAGLLGPVGGGLIFAVRPTAFFPVVGACYLGAVLLLATTARWWPAPAVVQQVTGVPAAGARRP